MHACGTRVHSNDARLFSTLQVICPTLLHRKLALLCMLTIHVCDSGTVNPGQQVLLRSLHGMLESMLFRQVLLTKRTQSNLYDTRYRESPDCLTTAHKLVVQSGSKPCTYSPSGELEPRGGLSPIKSGPSIDCTHPYSFPRSPHCTLTPAKEPHCPGKPAMCRL